MKKKTIYITILSIAILLFALGLVIVSMIRPSYAINIENIEENFHIIFEKINSYGTSVFSFLINAKETSSGFIAVKSLTGGGTSIVKYNESGTLEWEKSIEDMGYTDSYISDVIEISNDVYLITTDQDNTLIYNHNTDTVTVSTEEKVGHPSGRSVFSFGDNYITIGARQKDATSTTNTILIQVFNSEGTLINSKDISLDAYNDNVAIYNAYMGANVNDDTMYILAKDGEEIVILEIDTNLEVQKRVLTTTLLESDFDYLDYDLYTQIAVDSNNNIYFAISSGIYKIDNNDNLIKVIEGEYGIIEFTSIVIIDNYIITGGIYNNSASVLIYDEDFNLLRTIDISDYIEIDESDSTGYHLNILKTLLTTDNGFMATGMINNTPYAIEFSIPDDITCEEYNGTLTLNVNGNSDVENAFDNIIIPNNVTWTSSDSSISIIEGGKILGLSEGTTTITGTSNDSCNTYRIEVTIISNPITISNIYIVGGITIILLLSTTIYLYYKKKYKDL